MFRFLFYKLFPTTSVKGYTTVRYAFPVVVMAALFASLASVISDNASYVTITTDATSVVENQEFYILVNATAHVAVNAVDLVVSYPEDKMTIESIDTGTSVITLWTEEPYAKDGNIYLRGGTFRKGFIGEHTIARIKAKATAQGEARVLIKETQLLAGDGSGTEVPVALDPGGSEVKIAVGAVDGVLKGEATISVVTDTDGDGDVDLTDISRFMSAWFTKANSYDFNGDGKMTFKDFSIILAESFFN